MFNRAFQVRMVKKAKPETAEAERIENLTEKVAIVSDVAERIIKKIATAALCYVLVDTARQVVIARSINH